MDTNIESVIQEAAPSEAAEAPQRLPRQFISFRVGNEEFAIDIIAVREIKGWTQAATLPNQPDYNLGVMNLRGTIVPIFDLRCRFGMGLTEATPYHVVIIVKLQDRTIGLLVDAVSDILTVNADEIRPVPDMDQVAAAEFLSGIIAVDDCMVVLLSLEKLFSRGDVAVACDVAA